MTGVFLACWRSRVTQWMERRCLREGANGISKEGADVHAKKCIIKFIIVSDQTNMKTKNLFCHILVGVGFPLLVFIGRRRNGYRSCIGWRSRINSSNPISRPRCSNSLPVMDGGKWCSAGSMASMQLSIDSLPCNAQTVHPNKDIVGKDQFIINLCLLTSHDPLGAPVHDADCFRSVQSAQITRMCQDICFSTILMLHFWGTKLSHHTKP